MSQSTFCMLCNKNFSKPSNLRAHAKKFHSDKVAEIAPKKKYKISAFCNECSKTYSSYSSYVRHVDKFHKEEKRTLITKKKLNFQCAVCKKNFSHMKNLKYHRKTHEQTNLPTQYKVLKQCPLCNYTKFSKQQFLDHFQSVHDVSIHSENLEFSDFEDFMRWKTDVEKKNSVFFMNRNGVRTDVNLNQRIHYICHRSGIFKSKGRGIRRLKTQGTKKINGYCPSEIKLIILRNGKCKVTWTKTHIGHDSDLRHLQLTAAEKQQLAYKIATKVPLNAILDEIRDTGSKCESERLHLLTKKDLYNIKQNCNLNINSIRHTNISEEGISEETFRIEKEKFKAYLLQLADGIESMEQLEEAKKLVMSFQPTVKAIKNETNENVIFLSQSALLSSNETITSQTPLFKPKDMNKKIICNDSKLS